LEELDNGNEESENSCRKTFAGRECRRTSGRISADSTEEDSELGFVVVRVLGFFSTRRLTACLDSSKKYAASFPANLPARKLILSSPFLVDVGIQLIV